MDTSFLLKGLITGLIVGSPTGPIGVLCITNTLKKGRLHGLFSGLGNATADALYALIAGFGLTFISSYLIRHDAFFKISGGILIIIIGLIFLFSKSDKSEKRHVKEKGTSVWSTFFWVFLFSFTNPATLISFLAMFSSLGVAGPSAGVSTTLASVTGVFVGSAVWWVALAVIMRFLNIKIKMSPSKSKYVKVLSSLAIIGTGSFIALKELFFT